MQRIDFEIVTYGGGEVLDIVFNAIAVLLNKEVYQNILFIAANLMGVWVILQTIIKNNADFPFRWLAWVYIAMMIALYPKCTILINDPLTGFQRKIDRVPYILGAFAGSVSNIGHNITREMETYFSVPGYTNYSEHGLLFGSRIVKNLDKLHINNGRLQGNMMRFIKQCVVMESLSGGQYDVHALTHSDNIWQLVKANANQIIGFVYVGQEQQGIYSCAEGVKMLERDFDQEINKISHSFSQRLFPKLARTNQVDIKQQYIQDLFETNLQTTIGAINSKGSPTAQELIKQEMMINAIKDYKQSYAQARIELQQRETFRQIGDLAGNTLVIVRVLIEALAYSSFLYMVVLLLLPKGIIYFGKYIGTLVWLQLWTPLYAILNLVITVAATYRGRSFMEQDGFTMYTHDGLISLYTDLETLAAYAATAIPVIAYKLAQGSFDGAMSLAGQAFGSMQHTATAVAGEVTTGNYNLDNIAMGNQQFANRNAFKHDTSSYFSAGSQSTELNSGDRMTIATSGRFIGTHNQSNLPFNVTMNQAAQTRLSQDISATQNSVKQLEQSYNSSISQGFDNSVEFLANNTKSIAQHTSLGTSQSYSNSDAMTTAANFTKELQQKYNLSDSQAAAVTVGVGLGNHVPLIKLDSTLSGVANREQILGEAKNLASNYGITESLSKVSNDIFQGSVDTANQQQRSLQESNRQNYNHLQQTQAQYQEQQAKLEQYNQAFSRSADGSISFSRSLNEDFLNYLSYSPTSDGGNFQGDKARAFSSLHQNPAWGQAKLQQFIDNRFGEVAPALTAAVGINNNYQMPSPIHDSQTQTQFSQATTDLGIAQQQFDKKDGDKSQKTGLTIDVKENFVEEYGVTENLNYYDFKEKSINTLESYNDPYQIITKPDKTEMNIKSSFDSSQQLEQQRHQELSNTILGNQQHLATTIHNEQQSKLAHNLPVLSPTKDMGQEPNELPVKLSLADDSPAATQIIQNANQQRQPIAASSKVVEVRESKDLTDIIKTEIENNQDNPVKEDS
ncbi:MAG: conjugal transfer protein TraG N-terminal domain-containing protein [Pseudomonadota bacterium]